MAQELQQLVEDVAQLTGASTPDWMSDDAPLLRLDAPGSFYLVGLIGGKEVGKTALVNALAGQPLSAPTGFGRGTETAIAYAHESQAAALRELLEREAPGRFQIVTHAMPHLRGQVLLDLPDIDSLYADHLDLTRRMLRHMLYPVWIQSVEKYADQQPQMLLATVAQGNDPANFVFVLNKSDQMRPQDATEIRDDYAARIARVLKLPATPRVYMVSAIRPSEYELPQLRQTLANEKSPQDVQRSVQLATRQRERSLLGWVREQGLPQRADRLRRLERDAEDFTAARLAEPLVDFAIPSILDDPGYRLALIDRVMNARVARWPLVNLVHTLLSPILGLYRVSAAPAAISTTSLVTSHLTREGERSLSASVQATFALLHRTHAEVADLYRARKLWEDTAADVASDELRSALATALNAQRETAMRKLTGRVALLAPWRWLLTIGALLWFPFIQPILEVFLQNGVIAMNRQALLLIVKIFSAAYLLQAAGFLLIWFLFLWAWLRWDTSRRVNRLLTRWRRGGGGTDQTFNLATATLAWVDDLLDPIRQARQRTEEIMQRVDKLDSALGVSTAAA